MICRIEGSSLTKLASTDIRNIDSEDAAVDCKPLRRSDINNNKRVKLYVTYIFEILEASSTEYDMRSRWWLRNTLSVPSLTITAKVTSSLQAMNVIKFRHAEGRMELFKGNRNTSAMIDDE